MENPKNGPYFHSFLNAPKAKIKMSLIDLNVIIKSFLFTENTTGSMHDVMQDFATNGYVSDDLGRFSYGSAPPQAQTPPPAQQQQPQQQGMHLPLGRNPVMQSNGANLMSVATPLASQWLHNYREQLNSVWRNMSYTSAVQAQAQATVAMSPNLGMGMGLGLPLQPEQLRGASNPSNNKVHKRYNNNNKAKEVSGPDQAFK